MSHNVQIAGGALREIRALPVDARGAIGAAIDKLAADPRPAGAKKIADVADCYRVRSGDYRIVYTVKDSILTVNIVTVGHRAEVYKGLRGKVKSRG